MAKLSPVGWRTLECVFELAGFQFVRQAGSHRAYVREGTPRPVVIPMYREAPVFIIRANLRTAGMSREEYFRLLERCR
jgi:predicted RNA binding protein YcfA (HicA-like mRNA interferase family)